MNSSLQKVAKEFSQFVPNVDFWSLRLSDLHRETLCVRQQVLQPVANQFSRGALVSIIKGNGWGYAATSDLSPGGLKLALNQASAWAEISNRLGLLKGSDYPRPSARAEYETPLKQAWEEQSLDNKIELLQQADRALNIHDSIVDSFAYLDYRREDSLLTSSAGAEIFQRFHIINPALKVVANKGSITQVRTGGGAQSARQGGLEQLESLGFASQAPQLAEQAVSLLDAPSCPQGKMDLILAPNQMILQIHESIGHPLELDRILGDERNYAGTSFVTQDMFGDYQYGSQLLNVTYDPCHPQQLASYAYDDEGSPAQRQFIIRNGILQRPLGGAISQARTSLSGVANARQSDWFRPPIDRMANLNLEPGDSSVEKMIEKTERGVFMHMNSSWSIDDSRNKFQFGCELGYLIQDGEIKGLVRNPNYRGISATFWRNLVDVGDPSSFEVMGVSNCGKGEPNQMIGVGHASPTCRFSQVDIFGEGI